MKITARNFPRVIIKNGDNENLEVMEFARAEIIKYGQIMFGQPLTFSDKCFFSLAVDSTCFDEPGTETYSIDIDKYAICITGGSAAAVLYGIYGFLRRFCGVCFAAPGASGEYVPHLEQLDLSVGKIIQKPLLEYRGMQFLHRYDWEKMIAAIDWMVKNGFNYIMYSTLAKNSAADLRTVDPASGAVRDISRNRYDDDQFRRILLPEVSKRGLKLDFNHHNIRSVWLPPAKYFKAHPQWYSLLNGVRRSDAPQLGICTSNPEAVAEIIKNIKEFLSNNPEVKIVGLVPEDGFGGTCECDECRKLDYPGDKVPEKFDHRSAEGENQVLINRYFLLLNQVAEALQMEYPDLRIGALSYVDMQWPPRHLKLHQNILPALAIYWRCGVHKITELGPCERNNFFFDLIKQWKKTDSQSLILYEYYMGMNAQNSLPYPMGKLIMEEWKTLSAWGVQGATIQSNPLNYRVYGLNYLAFAAAAWNSETDYEAVRTYWLKGMFGNAADCLQPIFTALDQAAEKIAGGTEHISLKYPKTAQAHLLPDARNIVYFMDELTDVFIESCIARAEKACLNERERKQVKEFAAVVQYWKLAAVYFRLYDRLRSGEYAADSQEAALNKLRECFAAMEACRLSIENTGWARISRPIEFPKTFRFE
jgi:hypothetical protein